jgi:outer membrane beta-barrel protein
MRKRTQTSRWALGRQLRTALIVAGAALCVLTAGAAPAQAQTDVLEGQPSIRNKRQYLNGRNVVAPFFAVSVNDEYSRSLMGGLSWRYFIDSWIGVGVDIAGGAGVDTDLTDQINRELTRPDRTFTLDTSSLRLLAGAVAELVPFEGKFMLFGLLEARIDFHIDLGFGIALVSGTGRLDGTAADGGSISIMPIVGAGFRFFPTEWIAVGFDMKDHIVNRVLAVRRDGSIPAPAYGNNWLAVISVGFFFPTAPEIRP